MIRNKQPLQDQVEPGQIFLWSEEELENLRLLAEAENTILAGIEDLR